MMSQEQPLVSVVIPTYNNQKYIGESIDSVLGQTYQNIEIIVVDDGSTDDTEAFISNHYSQVEYVKIKNSGSAAARNTGIKLSKGEYIAFLDADDIWMSQKIEKQINEFRHQSIGLVYCDKLFINDKGDEIDSGVDWQYPSGWIFEKMLEGNYISTSSLVMVSRKVFDKVGYFDENPEMKCSQDSDLWIRVCHDYQVVFVDSVLVKYRYHEGGTSRSRVKTYHGKTYSFHKSLKLFGDDSEVIKMKIQKRLGDLYFSYLKAFIYERNHEYAQKALRGAKKYYSNKMDLILIQFKYFIIRLFKLNKGSSCES